MQKLTLTDLIVWCVAVLLITRIGIIEPANEKSWGYFVYHVAIMAIFNLAFLAGLIEAILKKDRYSIPPFAIVTLCIFALNIYLFITQGLPLLCSLQQQ